MATREQIPILDLIVGPTIEPVDLDFFKRDQKITTSSEDSEIDLYIPAARLYFERYTGRQLQVATYELRLEDTPAVQTRPFQAGVIELPKPPLYSVLGITLTSTESPETVLIEDTDFEVDAPRGPYARPGFVRPLIGTSWPSASGGVRILYQAGYGPQPGDVPELAKKAICFLAGHFYKFRANVYEGAPGTSISEIPIGAKAIMDEFKYSAYPTLPYPRTTWV